MTGKVQQQHVLRPAVGEQILDLPLDDIHRLVPDHVHIEAADLRVADPG